MVQLHVKMRLPRVETLLVEIQNLSLFVVNSSVLPSRDSILDITTVVQVHDPLLCQIEEPYQPLLQQVTVPTMLSTMPPLRLLLFRVTELVGAQRLFVGTGSAQEKRIMD
ncbi:hypothetical protein D0Y65_002956 [Glycine soja]|uniref:Uncharacterized protein n=1 Tax=Glycine soja TaxID=3848 RepID=A0A445LJR6_GLYSO|nr:hypothetical protein D0Y65_002956 [Glycine soja]